MSFANLIGNRRTTIPNVRNEDVEREPVSACAAGSQRVTAYGDYAQQADGSYLVHYAASEGDNLADDRGCTQRSVPRAPSLKIVAAPTIVRSNGSPKEQPNER
jgi:hypothetical protein